jgi:hypothetical protein
MHGDDLQVHGSVFRSNHAQKKPRRGGTKPVARGIPPYYRLRGSWRNGRLALRMLPLPHHPAVDQHDSGRPRARPVPGRSPIKATPRDPQPATPMKAGLGKSFIATGRLIARPKRQPDGQGRLTSPERVGRDTRGRSWAQAQSVGQTDLADTGASAGIDGRAGGRAHTVPGSCWPSFDWHVSTQLGSDCTLKAHPANVVTASDVCPSDLTHPLAVRRHGLTSS